MIEQKATKGKKHESVSVIGDSIEPEPNGRGLSLNFLQQQTAETGRLALAKE